MKNSNFLTLAALSFAAILSISGQSPRKEVEEVLTTECLANENGKDNPSPKKSEQRKSAAQRSMESDSQTSMNQKSAAKRSME